MRKQFPCTVHQHGEQISSATAQILKPFFRLRKGHMRRTKGSILITAKGLPSERLELAYCYLDPVTVRIGSVELSGLVASIMIHSLTKNLKNAKSYKSEILILK